MVTGATLAIVVERHSAEVTDVLRLVGLTHGEIEILLTTFRTDCGDLHEVNTDTDA